MSEPRAIPGERLPWMPLYADDFLASNLVARIGEIWSWRYILILLRAWTEPTPCFLPNDDIALLRLMGAPETDRMTAEFSAIREKFIPTQDGKHLYNEKQLGVFRKAAKEYRGTVERGKKGAASRWGKPAIIAESAPIPASLGALNASESAAGLMQMVNVAGQDWLRLLRDVISQAAELWKCEPQEAAEKLAQRWADYEKSPAKFKAGKRKFFADGLWRDTEPAAPKRRYLNA